MLYQPHFLYRLKLIFIYVLVKLEFLHFLLPDHIKDELPRGWNNQMFWTAFKSGGTKIYFTYPCKLKDVDSFEPKVIVDKEYQLAEDEIRKYYAEGYIGPFELIPPEDVESVRDHLIKLSETDSSVFSYANGDYDFVSSINGPRKSLEELSEDEKYYVGVLNTFERYLEDDLLLNLLKHPAITERCAQILGPDLVIWHNNHFPVAPHSKGSVWHQASRWFDFDMKEPILYPVDEEENYQITCWIALTDIPPERSCLKLVAGSQKEIYPMNLQQKKVSAADNGGRAYGRYDAELDYVVKLEDVRILPAKAGQCYLFCERVVHGSTDNTTDEERWAVGGRIIKADTRVFTKNMIENGLNLEAYGVRKIKLDNWKPLPIRGKAYTHH